MNAKWVKVDETGEVTRITLNRPDRRNALTHDFLVRLTEAVRSAGARSQTRVIALAANGPVFCAGMDLGEMQQRATAADAEDQWLSDARIYRDLLVAFLSASQPVVGVIQGPAVAGGMGLVLGCDLVVASENTWFELPEPKRGITAAMVTPLLVFRAGAGAANYCLLSGQRLTAADTLPWGICQKVVPPDRLEPAAAELIGSLLTGSPQALAATKQHVQAIAARHLLADLDAAVTASAAARATSDAREGLAAYLEKRKPSWQHEAK
jgi:methylglutaconyl-CoA hydratase